MAVEALELDPRHRTLVTGAARRLEQWVFREITQRDPEAERDLLRGSPDVDDDLEHVYRVLRDWVWRYQWHKMIQVEPRNLPIVVLWPPSPRWYEIVVQVLRCSQVDVLTAEDLDLASLDGVTTDALARAHYELGIDYFYGDRRQGYFFTSIGLDPQDEAVRSFRKALSLQPFNVQVCSDLVRVLELSNRPYDAIVAAMYLLEIEPGRAHAWRGPPHHHVEKLGFQDMVGNLVPEKRRELRAAVQDQLRRRSSGRRGLLTLFGKASRFHDAACRKLEELRDEFSPMV